MAAPNSTFDQALSAATYKYLMEGKFVDNIFKSPKLIGLFKQMGGMKMIDGGDSIVVPLEYATNPSVGSSAPWSEITIAETDEFTTAQYEWKQVDGAAGLSLMDIARNSGESQKVNLVKAKISNLERSLRENFNNQLYVGDADTSTNIHGIEQLVATTGTVGGIDSSAQSWWRSSVDSTAEALAEADMETQFNNLVKYGSAPDVILTTQTLYEKFIDLVRTDRSVQVPDARIAELGWNQAQFRGKPVVFDEQCSTSGMYMLNFEFLKLCTHKDFNFKVFEPTKLQKQHVMAYIVLWIGNLVISNRRMCARLDPKSG